MTTHATLTRVEGSMLGALAEAFAEAFVASDEVLYIDRDGPSFRYVLNYLRDPFAKPLLPRDPTERDSSREKRISMASQDYSAALLRLRQREVTGRASRSVRKS